MDGPAKTGQSTPPPRARNPRGSGGRLRDEIVAAASSLLAETGDEHALTLRAVARRAGIAAPSIYTHFADLDEIIAVVVLDARRRLDTAINDATGERGSAQELLRRGALAYLEFARLHSGAYRIVMERANPSANPAAAARARAQLNRAATLIQQAAPHVSERQASERAVTLWLALHGAATLPATQPRFAWPTPRDLATHVVNLVIQ